ncbi:MAG: hypothetical protein AB1432_14205 [Bacteroidota bacterium]
MNFQKIFMVVIYNIVFLILIITIPSCNILTFDNDNSSTPDELIVVPFYTLRAAPAFEDNGSIGGVFKCEFNFSNIERGNNYDELSDVELIITNQTVFNKYVLCDNDPVVNFDEEFVLAGMTKVQPHCIYIKEQNVSFLRDTLTYTVIIGKMICAHPEIASYMVVVPRGYLADVIEFKVIWGEER